MMPSVLAQAEDLHPPSHLPCPTSVLQLHTPKGPSNLSRPKQAGAVPELRLTLTFKSHFIYF